MIYPLLSKIGVPDNLQSSCYADFDNELQKKLLIGYDLLKDKKVLYITGSSNLIKDKFITVLIKNLIYNKKLHNIIYIPSPTYEADYAAADAYIFLNSCIINKKSTDKLREFLFTKINKGCYIIIECPSLETFVSIYGEDVVRYAAITSAVIDIPEPVCRIEMH